MTSADIVFKMELLGKRLLLIGHCPGEAEDWPWHSSRAVYPVPIEWTADFDHKPLGKILQALMTSSPWHRWLAVVHEPSA